jgi:hypothetical protein
VYIARCLGRVLILSSRKAKRIADIEK